MSSSPRPVRGPYTIGELLPGALASLAAAGPTPERPRPADRLPTHTAAPPKGAGTRVRPTPDDVHAG